MGRRLVAEGGPVLGEEQAGPRRLEEGADRVERAEGLLEHRRRPRGVAAPLRDEPEQSFSPADPEAVAGLAREGESFLGEARRLVDVAAHQVRVAEEDAESALRGTHPELAPVLDRALEQVQRLVGIAALQMREPEPAERVGPVQGIGRILERAPARGDAGVPVAAHRVHRAGEPRRRCLHPRVAERVADRRRLGGGLEGGIEVAHQHVVRGHREVRLPQPPPLGRRLEQRDGPSAVGDAAPRIARPPSLHREDVGCLAHGAAVLAALRRRQRLTGALHRARPIPEKSVDVRQQQEVLRRERRIVDLYAPDHRGLARSSKHHERLSRGRCRSAGECGRPPRRAPVASSSASSAGRSQARSLFERSTLTTH